jgi:hypothetical protein
MKTRNIHTSRRAILTMLACVVLGVGILRALADCNKYADKQNDPPQGDCDPDNNYPYPDGNWLDCGYQASTVNLWCRPIAENIACVPDWNPYNQPTKFSGYVQELAGWCINGVCNYSAVYNPQTETVTDWTVYTSVSPCPE